MLSKKKEKHAPVSTSHEIFTLSKEVQYYLFELKLNGVLIEPEGSARGKQGKCSIFEVRALIEVLETYIKYEAGALRQAFR